jgi:hypothetical protein
MTVALTDENNDKLEVFSNVYDYDKFYRLTQRQIFRDDNLEQTNSFATSAASDDFKTKYEYDLNGNITKLFRNDATGSTNGLSLDDLDMSRATHYLSETNILTHVTENYQNSISNVDIEGQLTGNYQYDEVGNLIKDVQEGIDKIEWDAYGRVKSITYNNDRPNLEFHYDAQGHRVKKIEKTKSNSGTVNPQSEWNIINYVRDISGNILATYRQKYNSESESVIPHSILCFGQYFTGEMEGSMIRIVNNGIGVDFPIVGNVTDFTLSIKDYLNINFPGYTVEIVSSGCIKISCATCVDLQILMIYPLGATEVIYQSVPNWDNLDFTYCVSHCFDNLELGSEVSISADRSNAIGSFTPITGSVVYLGNMSTFLHALAGAINSSQSTNGYFASISGNCINIYQLAGTAMPIPNSIRVEVESTSQVDLYEKLFATCLEQVSDLPDNRVLCAKYCPEFLPGEIGDYVDVEMNTGSSTILLASIQLTGSMSNDMITLASHINYNAATTGVYAHLSSGNMCIEFYTTTLATSVTTLKIRNSQSLLGMTEITLQPCADLWEDVSASLMLDEHHLYGSSRLGVRRANKVLANRSGNTYFNKVTGEMEHVNWDTQESIFSDKKQALKLRLEYCNNAVNNFVVKIDGVDIMNAINLTGNCGDDIDAIVAAINSYIPSNGTDTKYFASVAGHGSFSGSFWSEIYIFQLGQDPMHNGITATINHTPVGNQYHQSSFSIVDWDNINLENRKGRRLYELTNHLGNVNQIVSDKKFYFNGNTVYEERFNQSTLPIGWNANTNVTLTMENGRLKTSVVDRWQGANKMFNVTAGTTYKISVNVDMGTATDLLILAQNTNNWHVIARKSVTSSGLHEFVVTAPVGLSQLNFKIEHGVQNAAVDFFIDNWRVVEMSDVCVHCIILYNHHVKSCL